jgi:hypothetical protein
MASDSDDDIFDFNIGISEAPAAAPVVIAPFQTDAYFEELVAKTRAQAELDERFKAIEIEFNPNVQIATRSYKQVNYD